MTLVCAEPVNESRFFARKPVAQYTEDVRILDDNDKVSPPREWHVVCVPDGAEPSDWPENFHLISDCLTRNEAFGMAARLNNS